MKIEQIREEIDRVDGTFLSLIAERLELSAAVRRAKSGMRVWRPSREESHVRELVEERADTPPELVSRIWAELMSASLALQGPMQLHVSVEGDARDVSSLVRDRFGAALPLLSYPTASSALAAAYADPEGVANGAMPDMHILARLPRTGGDDWPRAVAVATADIQPSGADQSLVMCASHVMVPGATKRAEAGAHSLLSLDHYCADVPSEIIAQDSQAKIIGVLPHPLGRAL